MLSDISPTSLDAPLSTNQSLAKSSRTIGRVPPCELQPADRRHRSGIRAQFLRAVDAIADNIAEGAGQWSQRQFARFLEIALASAYEVDNQLERARALHIFDEHEVRRLQEQLWEVKRMLTAFHRTVKHRADADDATRSGN